MTAEERERHEAELTCELALRQAAACLEQGELDQAQRRVRQALELEPERAVALNLQGLIHFQQGAYAEAQAVFEQLAQQHPEEVTLQVNAGLAAYRQQRLDVALEHFRKVVELDPTYSRSFGYLGLVHLLRDERRLARAALQEAGLERFARLLEDNLSGEAAAQLTPQVEQRIEGLLLSSQGDAAPPLPYEGFAEISRLTRQNPLLEQQQPPPAASADQTAPFVDAAPRAEAEAEAEARTAAAAEAKAEAAPPRRGARIVEALVRTGPPLEAQLAEKLLIVPPAGAEQTLLQRGLLVLRVMARDFAHQRGGAVVLQERILLHGGALSFEQAERVRKGAAGGAFAVEGSPLVRLEGDGYLVCAAQPGRRVVVLSLAGEGLFLRETALLAWSSLLHFENGRIPWAGAEGPAVIHLSGSGFVALQLEGELLVSAVAELQPASCQLDHLVGWTEEVIPDQVRRVSDTLTVGFRGTGMVWLSFAKSTEESRGS